MVLNKSEMKTMKYYHDLYLKSGILLFVDVLEKFRNNNIKNYGLFPSHYLSAPSLSWNAMLNMAKVKFELISDSDIFFGKVVRGGAFNISNRYSKANNKYLKSHDPKKELKHIAYLDANNLHGYAMPKFLPASGFKWIDIKEFDLNKHTTNSSKGYHCTKNEVFH